MFSQTFFTTKVITHSASAIDKDGDATYLLAEWKDIICFGATKLLYI